MGAHRIGDRQTLLTADEALARLKDGNERFVSGHAKFPTVQKEVLAELARGQHPKVLESPEGEARRAANAELKMVGAVYDINTGRARFLE